MLAELGAKEALLFLLLFGVHIWTLATAARRGRWGWFLLVLLVPGITTLLFWLFNPRPVDKGPRPA